MKPLFFILLTLVLLNGSCKKDRLSKFYFQCKVDGVFYEPDNCANCNSKEIIGDTTLLLGANRGFEALNLGIIDNSNIKVGQYILNGIISKRGTYKFSTSPSDRFFTDSTHTGFLNITLLNKSTKIIEGNFQYEAYNIQQNKIVRITEGKFRLNYRTY